jgi:hypothetical protein
MVIPAVTARVQAQGAELDTKARIIDVISAGMAIVSLLFLVLGLLYAPTHYVIPLLSAMLLLSILAFLLNHKGYINLAAWVFLLGYWVFVVLTMLLGANAQSSAPYYLGIAVVLSGGLFGPVAPLLMATASVLATCLMVSQASLPPAVGNIPPWLGPILAPTAYLYLLASVSWLYGAETKRMFESLRRLAEEIRESVNVLGSAASQILAATSQVVARTGETAAAISQTTTTVDEVRQAAQLSNEKARYVSTTAQKAAQVGQNGRKAVHDTVIAIRRIQEQMDSIAQSIVRLSEQSQAISEMITLVSDLAEQSNLLAVNAAIEAAKADEHGKGFAVVAQEIRSLATQSKQATTQVRTILHDIQKATSAAVMAAEQGSKAVDAGVEQSAHADEAIHLLADNVAEAAQAGIQIAASSQQQLVGMDQMAMAMHDINQAGLQNATSTSQVEVTAQNLYELGQKLKQLTGQFHV